MNTKQISENVFVMYIRAKYDKTKSSDKNSDKRKFSQGESLEELNRAGITSKFKIFYSVSDNMNLIFSLPGSF